VPPATPLLDSDRDLIRVPRIDRGPRIGRTTTAYRCPGCGACHALRFQAVGVLAYGAAIPVFLLSLVSFARELAGRTSAWLGRVA
jgi:hypothetical protein